MTRAQLPGEHRHSTCRYGVLNPAFVVTLDGKEIPTCATICTWKPEEAAPPAMARAWGGLVEIERDCAVCPAHRPV